MKKYQRGFIDIPKEAFELLFILAIIGSAALGCFVLGILYWLFNHVTIV